MYQHKKKLTDLLKQDIEKEETEVHEKLEHIEKLIH